MKKYIVATVKKNFEIKTFRTKNKHIKVFNSREEAIEEILEVINRCDYFIRDENENIEYEDFGEYIEAYMICGPFFKRYYIIGC